MKLHVIHGESESLIEDEAGNYLLTVEHGSEPCAARLRAESICLELSNGPALVLDTLARLEREDKLLASLKRFG